MKTRFTFAAALLLIVGLALPAFAGPGGKRGKRGHGPNPMKMVKMLERHADELGIDEATLDQMKGLVEQNKSQFEALREEARAARASIKEAMDAPKPDKAAVLALVEQAGQARIEIQKLKMGVMIDLKALLTPEQIERVEAARAERRAERRGKRKGKRRGHRGPPADLE